MALGAGWKGWCCWWWDRPRRAARTVFFMVAMVASLLTQCFLPILVALGDVMVPCILISNFTCVRCYGFEDLLAAYSFKRSLIDIPLFSLIRSLLITCVYIMCDPTALSHGLYLGTVTLCSVSSILLLSIKACVFSTNSHIEAEASYSPSMLKVHVKKSWGMPVLFLSSVVFALGHMVVAYRVSCKARRKLLFHRVDPEAILASKSLLSAFQKVPRSPTPVMKTSKIVADGKRKRFTSVYDDGALSVRLLADVDSLFITCQGFTLHYKLCMPRSPQRSLSSITFLGCDRSSGSSGIVKLESDRHMNVIPQNQHSLHRSYSHLLRSSSLHDPLLGSSSNSPLLSNEIPAFSLDNVGEKDDVNKLSHFETDVKANKQCGIVLVHGFGGGVFSWRHVMGTLARQAGCAVAAFDRPGWGLTQRILRKDWEERNLLNPYRLETQVDLLLSFCLEMGFSTVILVGHDDGGLLALKAAERVQSSGNSCAVSVKAVVTLGVGLSREVVPGFARILLRMSLGKKHLVRQLLRTEITQVIHRRAWFDSSKLTTDVLSLYKAPLCVEGWDIALHEIGKLSCETVLSPEAASSLLRAVEQLPVLVVAGAEDELVSLQSVQTMASKLVNSRLVAISGCGHLPHEECPEALLAALSPFISRVVAGSYF